MAGVELSSLDERLGAEPAVRAVREALAGGVVEEAWIVGGSVRDALLGRPIRDVDLAVRGEPERAARAVAKAVGGPVFQLSEAFGGWRALHPSRDWICDVTALHGEGIEADLARRDFTVNAMAMPVEGGELRDPQAGAADLEAGVIRVLGGPTVERSAYADDPLRPLRLARLATELDLAPDPDTERLTREAAPLVASAAAERVWAELRRLVVAERVIEGLELSDRLGLTAVVLPELNALHGVEQSHFHHLDVYDHTLEVLRQALELERDPERVFGELAAPLDALMREPFADELDRWQALRLGALLHDVAKPATRSVRPDGRVTFIGHDSAGAEHGGGDLRAAAHQRSPPPVPGRPDAEPPRARLPRARAAARPPYGLPLPGALRARGGRGHAALLRRPPGHAREERRRRDRGAPRAGARADGRGPGLAQGRGAASRRCAATSSPGSSASRRARSSGRCWVSCARRASPATRPPQRRRWSWPGGYA